jgi:hypothetical protein
LQEHQRRRRSPQRWRDPDRQERFVIFVALKTQKAFVIVVADSLVVFVA